MIDNVAGMMNAAPTPMTPRVKMSWFGESTSATRDRSEPEDDHAELERAAAAEAVAERAGREQQAREHERVRVDDPLQLAVGRVEVADERRDRDIEDRVVDDDDEQAQVEHARGSTSAGDRRGSCGRTARVQAESTWGASEMARS